MPVVGSRARPFPAVISTPDLAATPQAFGKRLSLRTSVERVAVSMPGEVVAPAPTTGYRETVAFGDRADHAAIGSGIHDHHAELSAAYFGHSRLHFLLT